MRNRVSWNAIFGTFLVFVSTSLLPVSPALAQIEGEASNQAIIYITDVNADTSHEVLAAFEDPQIESVLIFDETIGSTIQNKVEGEITPYVTTRWKRPANARYQSTYTGLKALATAKGGPGSTLSISQTKSVSNSYSCNYTVSVASISSCVGFNVTGAESITITGSATVPEKIGNLRVKAMEFSAYPMYRRYKYDIREHVTKNGVVISYKKVGTGTADRACGVEFKRRYQY